MKDTSIERADLTFDPIANGGVLVPGFPAYAVTADGKVWTRYTVGGRRKRTLGVHWREKKPTKGLLGHLRVELFHEGKKQKYLVHRLILDCFVGKCPRGMQCCHNDGNPQNNAVSNLRWDTQEGNCADKIRHGTACVGSKQPMAKLTESDVIEIRKKRKSGSLLREIAAQYGVSVAKIGQITTGKNWRHVNG